MKKPSRYFLCLLLLALAHSLLASTPQPHALNVRVVTSHPHSTESFTQGLVLLQNDFLESSGHYRKSFISRHSAKAHKTHWQVKLPENIFAEGLTVLNGKIFVLTWKSQTLMVFGLNNQKPLASYPYNGEGWGLTHNGSELIRSDGSNKLYFHEPQAFKLLRSIEVSFNGKAVQNLNELEYARGLIWANIWQQNIIVAIDPTSGQVQAYADLSALTQRQPTNHNGAVLNGIAYDAEKDAFWVTGKYWPTLYLVKFE